MRTVSESPSIVSTENGCSNLPTPAEICRSDFGVVAQALWPNKTAATLAHIAGGNERTARDWLAGRTEPPGCFAALILARCFPKRP